MKVSEVVVICIATGNMVGTHKTSHIFVLCSLFFSVFYVDQNFKNKQVFCFNVCVEQQYGACHRLGLQSCQ